jgi:HPt (histidine-containing phosphotransfer) domain-containing protein
MSDQCLEDMAIWDQSSLMRRLAGKAALKDRLTKLFVQDFPIRQAQLIEALESGDMARIAAASHALKGMAGNISALRYQALSAKIEAAAKSEDGETIKVLASLVADNGAALLDLIHRDISGEPGGQGSEAAGGVRVEAAKLREALAQLHGKLERGECVDSSLLSLLSSCSQQGVTLVSDSGEHALEANLASQATQLCSLIERFDFEPALMVVGDMMRIVSERDG